MSDGSADSPAGRDGTERGTELKWLREPSSACTKLLNCSAHGGKRSGSAEGTSAKPIAGVSCAGSTEAQRSIPPVPGSPGSFSSSSPRKSPHGLSSPIKGRAPAAAAQPQPAGLPQLPSSPCSPWLSGRRVELPGSSPPELLLRTGVPGSRPCPFTSLFSRSLEGCGDKSIQITCS